MGTRGQNVKLSSLCQPADARMRPTTAACASACYSTCAARVMISDARADSEPAVGA